MSVSCGGIHLVEECRGNRQHNDSITLLDCTCCCKRDGFCLFVCSLISRELLDDNRLPFYDLVRTCRVGLIQNNEPTAIQYVKHNIHDISQNQFDTHYQEFETKYCGSFDGLFMSRRVHLCCVWSLGMPDNTDSLCLAKCPDDSVRINSTGQVCRPH